MRHHLSRETTLGVTVLVGLLVIGAVAAGLTKSSHDHDDSQILLANEKAWAKAALDADADRMASYMADEYLELAWEPAAKGAPGHWSATTKAEWVGSVRSHKDVYTSVNLRNLTAHVQGNLALVTGEYSQKGTSGGKDISGSGIYANTWSKRDGRWLVVHSVFP